MHSCPRYRYPDVSPCEMGPTDLNTEVLVITCSRAALTLKGHMLS